MKKKIEEYTKAELVAMLRLSHNATKALQDALSLDADTQISVLPKLLLRIGMIEVFLEGLEKE